MSISARNPACRSPRKNRCPSRKPSRGGNDMSASVVALKALCQAFNDHDLDRIMNFFADDAVLEMPRGPDPWGRRHVGAKAVRDGLAARFEGLPDVHYA